MQKDEQEDKRKFLLIAYQIIANATQHDRDLQKTLCSRVFLHLAHPNRRSNHSHQGTDRRNQADLFTAKPQADKKEIHERQDESPSAHKGKVICSCEKKIPRWQFHALIKRDSHLHLVAVELTVTCILARECLV